MRPVLLALLLAACGGGPDPILRNAPQPSTSAVAGAAAAIAGAATLAAPNAAAARVQEANRPDDDDRPQRPGPNVPADVLDRLDEEPAAPPPDPAPASELGADPTGERVEWNKKAPPKATPPQKPKPTPIKPPTSNPLAPGN
jgi:hypothetical protein